MSHLLAIDPGVHECATALFGNDGGLAGVLLIPALVHWRDAVKFRVDHVVAEVPQSDGRVGVHNLTLMRNACYLAGTAHLPPETCGDAIRFVTPTEWKGSTPKPIHHTRVWAALTPAERALFPADTEARIERAVERGAKDAWRKEGAYYYGKGKGHEVHNLLDAAGLGLWHLGRLAK